VNDIEYGFMIIGFFFGGLIIILAILLCADFLIQCYNKLLVKRFVAMKKNKREFNDKT